MSSLSLLCLFSSNFLPPRKCPEHFGHYQEQVTACVPFSHSWSKAFLKNTSLCSHCWAQSRTVGEAGIYFFSPTPRFPGQFLQISQQCHGAAVLCYTNRTCVPTALQVCTPCSRGQHYTAALTKVWVNLIACFFIM